MSYVIQMDDVVLYDVDFIVCNTCSLCTVHYVLFSAAL